LWFIHPATIIVKPKHKAEMEDRIGYMFNSVGKILGDCVYLLTDSINSNHFLNILYDCRHERLFLDFH